VARSESGADEPVGSAYVYKGRVGVSGCGRDGVDVAPGV